MFLDKNQDCSIIVMKINTKQFIMETQNVILQLEGNTNDLLQVAEANTMKRTSLVYCNPVSKEIGEEVITVSIDSTNEALTFPIFDSLIGKKIRVTIETIE